MLESGSWSLIGLFLSANLKDVRTVMTLCKKSNEYVGKDEALWKVLFEQRANSSVAAGQASESYKTRLQNLMIGMKYSKMKTAYSAKKGQYILLQDIEFPSNIQSLERNSIQLVDHLNNFLYYNNKNKGHGERITKCFYTITRCLNSMRQYHTKDKLLVVCQKVVDKFFAIFGLSFFSAITNYSTQKKAKPNVQKEKLVGQLRDLEVNIGNVLLYFLKCNIENSIHHKILLVQTFLSYAQRHSDQQLFEALWECLKSAYTNDDTRVVVSTITEKLSVDHLKLVTRDDGSSLASLAKSFIDYQ